MPDCVSAGQTLRPRQDSNLLIVHGPHPRTPTAPRSADAHETTHSGTTKALQHTRRRGAALSAGDGRAVAELVNASRVVSGLVSEQPRRQRADCWAGFSPGG